MYVVHSAKIKVLLLLLLTTVVAKSVSSWTEEEWERTLGRIPKHHLKTIIPVMMNFNNETSDFSKMHVRNSIANYMGLIFTGFSLLGFAGLLAQIMIVTEAIETLRYTMSCSYKRNIVYLVINTFNDFFKMVVVYSFSFIQMTYVVWPYGSFWCYLLRESRSTLLLILLTFLSRLAMIQDFCFNFSTMVILVIMSNRAAMFRHIGNEPCQEMIEQNYGLPIGYGMFLIIIASVCPVVFYSVFIEYISMENYLGDDFHGIGICVGNLVGNAEG